MDSEYTSADTDTTTPAAVESYDYWQKELKASMKMLKKWHQQVDKIVERYKGQRTNRFSARHGFELNLFNSNVTTLESMLYGNTPKIDVSRRYADFNDDVGRVAATVMERVLNLDIADHGGELDAVLKATLQDRLLGGLGTARVRYDMTSEMAFNEELGIEEERLVSEDALVEYVYWGDILWSWARNFSDVRWIAYRSYMTKDAIQERFPDADISGVQFKHQKVQNEDNDRDPDLNDPNLKGEVWEIWDKDTRRVRWVSFGCHSLLDAIDDPLGLKGFYTTPPFFLANPTTSLYIPTPDYVLAQDLYNEVDKLQERISIITEAVKVVGVYDASAESIQRMFSEGIDNDLIPVDNWALFGEKQGLKGQIDWVPLDAIVAALDKLRELRTEHIGLIQQVTGMSDIMRGGLESAYEGVGQSQMKAKFGSIRVQALQDQFARFASDLFQIKAEIISRHFDEQTIAQRSNLQNSPDAELLPSAVAMIKRPEIARLHVVIRPESVAMVDYAQLKQERTEYINALAIFLQSASPVIEQEPKAKPFLLSLLQWGLAGFKGASEIEGVIDKAIEAAQQEQDDPEQQKQSPEMIKTQMQIQLEKVKHDAQMQAIQAKAQADMQLRRQDEQSDIQTSVAQHQAKIAEIQADMQNKLAEISAKMQADISVEEAKASANITQTNASANAEMSKDILESGLDMKKEETKALLKIQEIAEASKAKIKEAEASPEPSSGGDE